MNLIRGFDRMFPYGDEEDGEKAVEAFDRSYLEDDDAYAERKQRERERKQREWEMKRRLEAKQTLPQGSGSVTVNIDAETRKLTARLMELERKIARDALEQRLREAQSGALRTCTFCMNNTNSEDSESGEPICGACWPTRKRTPSSRMIPARPWVVRAADEEPQDPQSKKPVQCEPAKGRAAVIKGEECP